MRNCIYYKKLMGVVLMTLLGTANSSSQMIAPASDKTMCSALTSDDFTKAGVPVLRLREANLDDNKSAYCIYDAKAGKVEFDIFYPAGDTPAEAHNAIRAAQSAIGGKFEAVRVPGADEASSNAASPKSTASSIVVQKGTTVFNISVPESAEAGVETGPEANILRWDIENPPSFRTALCASLKLLSSLGSRPSGNRRH